MRVYEKLRRHLSAIAGVAAFQSLAFRALTLAKSEAPCLSAVQVSADGWYFVIAAVGGLLSGIARAAMHGTGWLASFLG